MTTEKKPKQHFGRFYVVVFTIALVGLFLSYRAVDIQVVNNEFLQSQGDVRHLRTLAIPAHRGMVLDRNGEVLAVSSPVSTVWADPSAVPLDHPQMASLAKLLDRPLKDVRSQIQSNINKEFTYLRRHITPSLWKKIAKLEIPGVAMLREFRRFYPTAEVASHILGFTNIDDQGLEGIELLANQQLQGKPGKNQVIQDRMGHIIESVDLVKASQPGQDLQLSIDKRLQYIAYRELKKAMELHNAKSASMVVMDVHSGEVLAMVNQPSFNPNNINNSDKASYRNRAVTDLFEPGSTIKPFVVAAALKTGHFSPETPISTAPGYMRVGKAVIRDVHNYGELDIAGVIKKSSNVGISKIALHLEPEMLWESLSDMGFGELSKSQFPGETKGYLPFFGEWTELVQATVSFGYGISATPLQLAQSYTMFANGGYLKPASFFKTDNYIPGKRILSEEISQQMLIMMESVVSREGTAYQARIDGYRVAGKTGTMKKLGESGYLDDHYRSAFVGIVPVSKPQFVAVVVVDDPQGGEYYGGKVAAPVFSSVMADALRLFDVNPDMLASMPVQIAKLGEK